METELYIGQSKVVQYEQDTTVGLASYRLDDGSFGDCTIEQFASMAAPEAYPDGRIAVRKWRPTLKKLLRTLREDNMRYFEKSFLIQQLELSIDDIYDKGISKLLDIDFREEVTLQRLNEIVAPDEAPVRKPPVLKTETNTEESPENVDENQNDETAE